MRNRTLSLVLFGSLATVSLLAGCAAQASFEAGGGKAQQPAATPPPPPPAPAPAPAPTPAATATSAPTPPAPAPAPTTTTTPAPKPAPAPAPAKSDAKVTGDKVVIPNQVEFETGKSTLKATDETTKALDEIKAFLDANPRVTKLRIEGHTDNVGAAATNLELSGQRALTVKTTVVGKGIDKARIIAVGCGQDKPIADNGTEAGRAQNRRTEFRIAELSGKPYMGHDPTGGCKTFE
jgi:OOP family OmpA-OmpF porin